MTKAAQLFEKLAKFDPKTEKEIDNVFDQIKATKKARNNPKYRQAAGEMGQHVNKKMKNYATVGGVGAGLTAGAAGWLATKSMPKALIAAAAGGITGTINGGIIGAATASTGKEPDRIAKKYFGTTDSKKILKLMRDK